MGVSLENLWNVSFTYELSSNQNVLILMSGSVCTVDMITQVFTSYLIYTKLNGIVSRVYCDGGKKGGGITDIFLKFCLLFSLFCFHSFPEKPVSSKNIENYY